MSDVSEYTRLGWTASYAHIASHRVRLASEINHCESAHRRVEDIDRFDLRNGAGNLGLRCQRNLHAEITTVVTDQNLMANAASPGQADGLTYTCSTSTSTFHTHIMKDHPDQSAQGHIVSAGITHLLLLGAVREDGGAVLRADVVLLAVHRRGVVAREEQVHQLLV